MWPPREMQPLGTSEVGGSPCGSIAIGEHELAGGSSTRPPSGSASPRCTCERRGDADQVHGGAPEGPDGPHVAP